MGMPVECTKIGALTKSGRVVAASEVAERSSYAASFVAVSMSGHEAEESLQRHHGLLHRCGEDAGEGTGGGEDPTIHTPPIVEQIAYANL